MFVLLLALGALAAGARADCDACVEGQCVTQKPILAGFSVTDRLAFDHSTQTLYLQLNDNLNTGIFLRNRFPIAGSSFPFVTDFPYSRLINIMNTKGMAVDISSNTLYMRVKDANIFYRCDLTENVTETILAWDKYKYLNLWDLINYGPRSELVLMESYGNNTSAFYFIETDTYLLNRTLILNYPISDFIVTRAKLFFVSNNTLYVCNMETDSLQDPPVKQIGKWKHMVISGDNFDVVYISDATEKVIYAVHQETEELKVYAAYNEGYVEDFVVSYGRIFFRDADGSVKQWVNSADTNPGECEIQPPHDHYFIKKLGRDQNEVGSYSGRG